MHSLYSLAGSDEEKEKIYSKITAMEKSFHFENEKFDANDCVAAGDVTNEIYEMILLVKNVALECS